MYTKIFTIQNGLLTKGIVPEIDFKFDLKGASLRRELGKEAARKILAKNIVPTWNELDFIKNSPHEPPQGFFPNGIELCQKDWDVMVENLQKDAEVNLKIC